MDTTRLKDRIDLLSARDGASTVMSLANAAKVVGVTSGWLWKLHHQGELKTDKIGSRLFVTLEELARWSLRDVSRKAA